MRQSTDIVLLWLAATLLTPGGSKGVPTLSRKLDVPWDYPPGLPVLHLPGFGFQLGSRVKILPNRTGSRLVPTSLNMADLFAVNGTVLVLTKPSLNATNGISDLVGYVIEVDLLPPNEDLPTLNVRIRPVPDLRELCLPGYRVCFFGTGKTTYSLPDSIQPGTVFDVLVHPVQLRVCPAEFKVHYKVQTGAELVNIDPILGSLVLVTNLDPDRSGDRFRVVCSVQVENHVTEHFLDADIRVYDVNNHAPFLQLGKSAHFDIDLSDVHVGRPLSGQFNVLDRDSPKVNDIRVSVEEDRLLFFKVQVETIFPRAVNGAMLIHAVVTPVKEVTFPDPYYKFKVVFEDRGLTKKGKEGKVVFKVCIHNRSEDVLPETGEEVVVYLSKSAAQYTQLANLSFIPRNQQGYEFFLEQLNIEETNTLQTPILGVTPKSGLVYVRDAENLANSEELILNLLVIWKAHRKEGNYFLTVHLVEDTEGKQDVPCGQSCSIHPEMSSCVSSCGPGASNGHCQWRLSRSPGGNLTSSGYATCSPSLDTCPNGLCDELERTIPDLCPQDCASPSDLHGELSAGPQGGIRLARGTCYCFGSHSCTCHKAPPPRDNSKDVEVSHQEVVENISRTTNVQVLVKDASGFCGSTCLLVIVSAGCCSCFLLIALFLIHLRREYRRRRKTQGTADCRFPLSEGVPSNYVDYPRGPPQRLTTAGCRLNGQEALRSFVSPSHQMALGTSPCSRKLSVDPKWEFPREKLLIEEVLGEGEFGRVVKARAWAIKSQPGWTPVAVKMVKGESNWPEQDDLLSELNLLKEVEHPNVIRLMGTCSQLDGPLFVIVELAELGSLRSHLRMCRRLDADRRRWTVENPAYLGGVGTRVTLTIRDLLSFAWQVARGMAYLGDMKVVHRDLAARNVLLTNERVIKISDFGLSRDVYEKDTYIKRSNGRVPVKWMAIESLQDHIYTTKSDVWSFGVVLWEIVTIGSSPYPGVTPERLFNLLKAGYRMEKPPSCSQEVYSLMSQCWRECPSSRPCFKDLTQRLDSLLQDTAIYLDLDFTTKPIHRDQLFSTPYKNYKEEQYSLEYGHICTMMSEEAGPSRREDWHIT